MYAIHESRWSPFHIPNMITITIDLIVQAHAPLDSEFYTNPPLEIDLL